MLDFLHFLAKPLEFKEKNKQTEQNKIFGESSSSPGLFSSFISGKLYFFFISLIV